MINIPPVGAEKVFDIYGFPVTNAIIMSFITVVFLSFMAFLIKRGFNVVPKGAQNFFEFLIEKLLETMEGVFGTRRNAERYMPVVATIFLFVLFSNWLGLLSLAIPLGFPEVHNGHEVFVPVLRASTSDLNFTLALAIVTVLLTNILGIAAIGFWKHFGKFITFKSPIAFFVGILELISEVARMVAFSFRLFGNIFAGEVMLVIAAFFLPYILPVPLLAFEVFVGFIQATVFAMLAAVFISIAITSHDGEGAHH